MKIYILLGLCLLLNGCFWSKPEISGEVFIVTQGAANIKLGLVEVRAYPETVISKFITDETETLKQAAASQKLKLFESERACKEKPTQDCVTQVNFNRRIYLAQFDPAFYYAALPAPIAANPTNADGKFSIKLPKADKYVLVAHGSRKVFDKTEDYYWFVRFDASNGENKALTLSNNNSTDSNSTDSLLPIAIQ